LTLEEIQQFLQNDESPVRRRDLLPWWVKVICWLYILLGIAIFIDLPIYFFSKTISLSIYAIQSSTVLSSQFIFITAIFILKGITGFGLWFEKDWGVKVAVIDSIIGIVICCGIIIYSVFTTMINFRLELIILVPFLLKCQKIQPFWEDFQNE
jgi:hypothetical protein